MWRPDRTVQLGWSGFNENVYIHMSMIDCTSPREQGTVEWAGSQVQYVPLW